MGLEARQVCYSVTTAEVHITAYHWQLRAYVLQN